MRRVGILFALAIAFAPLVFAEEKPASFTGKIVPLADVLKAEGIELDREAGPHWVALVSTDGKVYPIVRDAGGRRFFKDPRLLQREFRVSGKVVKGTNLLQVVSAVSLVQGQPHDLYYWCDICAIKRHELNDCECCGGPMILKEDPLDK